MMSYYIGIDVGTGGVRGALVSHDGKLLKSYTHPLHIWQPCCNYYEQSTTDIWNGVCTCVKNVTKDVDATKVKGIGFDATCSLVVLDSNGAALTVSPSGSDERNVIMWLDHRAEKQMQEINSTKHPILRYVGHKISLEMSLTKVLWLKQNLSEKCWNKAGHFMELPDFLTWKATGSTARSAGCVGPKWLYQTNSWDESFLREIGLEELIDDNFAKIGSVVLLPGDAVCDTGLNKMAADQLGLLEHTPVATGIIDAHAGGVGCIGCTVFNSPDVNVPLINRMVLISGTSTCHMVVSDKEVPINGVWGPNYSAMISGMWNHEAGQSASGKLIDHLIETHAAYQKLIDRSKTTGRHIHSELEEILDDLTKKQALNDVSLLTRNFHMWPDYHGNRSPISDSTLTGMISGLSLSCDLNDLAVLYLAAIQALAYGTRHIIETYTDSGYDIRVIYACGGLSKNQLYIQIHSDITGLPIVLPDEKESVLLGSAILASIAAHEYPTMQVAMDTMCGDGHVVRPNRSVRSFHDNKYKVFRLMLENQQQYRNIMRDDQ
ncbi:FGGY carbohydrate kinase domain-containing protein-like isoform X2 [Tubulanus polymorphus]|uniref:FGGY carbohydrate kinase domain-containing protein-like isoform X2 n=1 Tax=Tubulanus polymorphus TaxID=672921 RepID=UPI003DA39D5E